MSTDSIILPAVIGGGLALLFGFGIALLWQETRNYDLKQRIEGIVHGARRARSPALDLFGILLSALRHVGDRLRDTAFMSEKDVNDFEKILTSTGLNARSALGVVIGLKAVLPVFLALVIYALANAEGFTPLHTALGVAAALPAGMLLPNYAMGALQSRYRRSLEDGLPDALDLIVICSDAGLGLETAIARIAAEMREANPAVALEFNLLDQEMRLLSDRRRALANFSERSSAPVVRRMAATIIQTIEYGTPLSRAFGALAAEMRQERLTRMEERASKLPALLVIPMMLFILPCLFLVIMGPAAIRVMATFKAFK